MGLSSSMDAVGLLQTFPSDGSTTVRCQLLPFGLYVTKNIPKGNTWIDIGTVSLGDIIPSCVFVSNVSVKLASTLTESSDLITNEPIGFATINSDVTIGLSWNGGTTVNILARNSGDGEYHMSFVVAGWIIMGF